MAGPKKKIQEFTEEFSKITYPVQFEALCKILEQPVSYSSPEIGLQMHQTME
jgi:hypothetical protein